MRAAINKQQTSIIFTLYTGLINGNRKHKLTNIGKIALERQVG